MESKTKSKPNLLKKVKDAIDTKRIKKAVSTNKKKEEEKKIPAPFKILLCIGIRGTGEKIINALNEQGINLHFFCQGKGTANRTALDLLGIESEERDVIIAIVNSETHKNVVKDATEYFNKNNIKNCLCCLLRPKSADQAMLKFLKEQSKNKENK